MSVFISLFSVLKHDSFVLRCSPDTTDICVHGQCMPAGCDGILGSKAKYNKCGLCNTGNKHCRRVTGKLLLFCVNI